MSFVLTEHDLTTENDVGSIFTTHKTDSPCYEKIDSSNKIIYK